MKTINALLPAMAMTAIGSTACAAKPFGRTQIGLRLHKDTSLFGILILFSDRNALINRLGIE